MLLRGKNAKKYANLRILPPMVQHCMQLGKITSSIALVDLRGNMSAAGFKKVNDLKDLRDGIFYLLSVLSKLDIKASKVDSYKDSSHLHAFIMNLKREHDIQDFINRRKEKRDAR
jgi:hypothetical protein